MRQRAVPLASWQRWLVGLALSSLVTVQCLALVHGIGHRSSVSAARQNAGQAVPGKAVSSVLALVYGHDEGSSACRLLDQLVQASPLASAAPVVVAAASHAGVPCASELPARQAAPRFYRARAPPFLA